MSNKTEGVPALITSEYPALSTPVEELRAIFEENMAGDSFSAMDLRTYKVPSGGGVVWQFKTLDGVKALPDISGVVAFFLPGRKFWREKMGQRGSSTGTPPDCFSPDGLCGIGTPGGNCAACPNATYSKANPALCAEFRNIFLIEPGTMLPSIVRVPPSSLGSFKAYRSLLTQEGIPMSSVLTKFSLEEATSAASGTTFARIKFGCVARMDPEQVKAVRAYTDVVKPIFASAHATMAASSGDTPAEGRYDGPPPEFGSNP